MAHIEKRAEKHYRVRYRDPAGRERSKTFHRLGEARRFKAAVEEAMGRGLWVDPRAGRPLLKEFASLMERRPNLSPSTSERIAGFMRRQILPAF